VPIGIIADIVQLPIGTAIHSWLGGFDVVKEDAETVRGLVEKGQKDSRKP
jgi:hypothetical protein